MTRWLTTIVILCLSASVVLFGWLYLVADEALQIEEDRAFIAEERVKMLEADVVELEMALDKDVVKLEESLEGVEATVACQNAAALLVEAGHAQAKLVSLLIQDAPASQWEPWQDKAGALLTEAHPFLRQCVDTKGGNDAGS